MRGVITDSPEAARRLLRSAADEWLPLTPAAGEDVPTLHALFGTLPLYRRAAAPPGWHSLLIRDAATGSQFDALIELLRGGHRLPDGMACLAGHGTGFHGSGQRAWTALPGNIHLSVHFAPQRPVQHVEAVFTALGAVACVEALARVGGVTPRIKWVNDILVAGCKIGGVLAWTQMQGRHVASVVIGIGLNVEAVPDIARSPDVPAASALREFTSSAVEVADVVEPLLEAVARNYRLLLDEGSAAVVERYRAASAVLDRAVAVVDDRGMTTAQGRVSAIGDDLALHFAGRDEPVRSGRVVMHAPARQD